MGCTLTAKEEYVLDNVQYEGQMTSYIVDGELLNKTVEKLFDLKGNKKYLNKENKILSYLWWYLSFLNSGAFVGHGLNSIISSVDKHSLSQFIPQDEKR